MTAWSNYGPAEQFCTSSGNFFFEERYDFGTKKELRRSIPIKDPFFFFREHPDFGTKIGILEIDSS